MTFAALFVSEKREKEKSIFMYLAGEQCSPLLFKAQISPTDKKIRYSIRFFFCYRRRKRKSYQKENAEKKFRALRSTTDAAVGSRRLPQKAGENFSGARKLSCCERKF